MIEFVYSQMPGSLVTVLLLLIAHLTLWDRVGRLWRVTAYAIGCSCIAIGMSVSALITRDVTALQGYVLHLAPGGLVILLAWSARGWQAARDQARQDAAGYLSQVAGSVRILAALNDSGIAIRPEERLRRKAMRQELRRILAALDAARDERIRYRAAYHAACAKRG